VDGTTAHKAGAQVGAHLTADLLTEAVGVMIGTEAEAEEGPMAMAPTAHPHTTTTCPAVAEATGPTRTGRATIRAITRAALATGKATEGEEIMGPMDMGPMVDTLGPTMVLAGVGEEDADLWLLLDVLVV